MNEQLKDFLKKASEDESIKDELKALEGLSAEENAEQQRRHRPCVGQNRRQNNLAEQREIAPKVHSAVDKPERCEAAGRPVPG